MGETGEKKEGKEAPPGKQTKKKETVPRTKTTKQQSEEHPNQSPLVAEKLTPTRPSVPGWARNGGRRGPRDVEDPPRPKPTVAHL